MRRHQLGKSDQGHERDDSVEKALPKRGVQVHDWEGALASFEL
jgi:hypothetical protein